MNQTPQELKDFQAKVRRELAEPMDAREFCQELQRYAKQGQVLLAPAVAEVFDEMTQRRDEQAFSNPQMVVEWCHKHKVVLKAKMSHWFMNLEKKVGYINGLEKESVGIPRVTNGIDVWIERADGTIFVGHRDWLIYYKVQKDRAADGTRPTKSAAKPTRMPTPKALSTAIRIVNSGDLSLLKAKFEQLFGEPFTFVLNGNKQQDITQVAHLVDRVVEKASEIL